MGIPADTSTVPSALVLAWLNVIYLFVIFAGTTHVSATANRTAPRHKWAGNQWLRAHEEGHVPEPRDLELKKIMTSRHISVAMCAAMKAENMTDVREWLLYHRCSIVAT